jgi:hypothetical protein
VVKWGRRRLGEPGVGCPGMCMKVGRLGKSGFLYNTEVRHGSDISVYREVIDATLPGKAASHNL